MVAEEYVQVRDAVELRALLGEPRQRVKEKVRDRLHEMDRRWLARSPLCLMATANADGWCDVSPKGDPAGLVSLALDDRTVAVPDRLGNRRADSYHNILTNPQVGLLYLVPGRGETLRINGRARIVRAAPFFDELAVGGKRPALALVVDVQEVYFHCSKAFLRSKVWDAASWQPDQLPKRALIAKAVEAPDVPLAELEAYYSSDTYGKDLY